jgi:hypothetical protein
LSAFQNQVCKTCHPEADRRNPCATTAGVGAGNALFSQGQGRAVAMGSVPKFVPTNRKRIHAMTIPVVREPENCPICDPTNDLLDKLLASATPYGQRPRHVLGPSSEYSHLRPAPPLGRHS